MTARLLNRLPLHLLCIPLLLGAASSARAEEARPLKKFLMLGFYEDKNPSPELRDRASDEILNNGQGTALRPLLQDNDQELACFQLSCLKALAERFYDADYIVGGSVVPLSGTSNYQVRVWIFDTKATDKLAQELPIWNKDECVGCQDKDAARSDKLASLLRKTIAERILKPEHVQPPPVKTGSCWTFARGLTLGAGGSLTVAGLSAGASVLALADPYLELQGSNGMTYHKDGTAWRPYSAPGFAAMGVGLAGLITALAGGRLFSRGAARDANGACLPPANPRWSAGRGVAVGTFAGFLAAGLSAALPLTIANHNVNVTCIQNKNDAGMIVESYPCDWSSNMGLAWGLSGGALLGLSISLAWPVGGGAP